MVEAGRRDVARDRAARPEAKALRLFVATDIPVRAKDSVALALEPWRRRFPGGRWVLPDNWHVTVKFLGSVWPRLFDWVLEEVEGVAMATGAFESRAEGLGAFPTSGRARVLWAGLSDPGGGFADLASALDAALAREFAPEKRAFTPHLTVARFDPPAPLGKDLGRPELRSEPFPVEAVVLYRSHLMRPAPRYEALRAFPLEG